MKRYDAQPKPEKVKAFRRAVLRFYRSNKRDLPWRHTRDPYRILVSEVMLQQTQVERVIPKYRSFLARFPTLRSLARARFADVLREWLGLGYNSRALRLWQCARTVARDGGTLPADIHALERLPGIGKYTAAAIAAFAFGSHVPAVDVNVRRVLTRALAGGDEVAPKKLSLLALDAMPASGAADWTQALMDVGSAYCRAIPRCAACPVRPTCMYARERRNRPLRDTALEQRTKCARPFAGSNRFYRGRVMHALGARGDMRIDALGREVKEGFGVSDGAWLHGILSSLERDGLIRIDQAKKKARLP